MVERAVHLSVRALVSGIPVSQAAAAASIANPGPRTTLGPFEIEFEAARPRILPGEENRIALKWRTKEPTEATARLEVVVDVPAELSAPSGGRSAQIDMGGGNAQGEAAFVLTGQDPGGVTIDGLLTLEDADGIVLGRAKAGFTVARHRVIIADVEAQPSVVAAGGAVTIRARFLWTGSERVRGTIGGRLKRRADGQVIELHREKASAMGERTQEWQLKAPVDQLLADFDVELTFEGREAAHKASFGKTGVLAVRPIFAAEVVSITSSAPRAGVGDEVTVRALVRNTGVEAAQGSARLQVLARLPGSQEADFVAGVPEKPEVTMTVPAQESAEAIFALRVPAGLEGSRLEGLFQASLGTLSLEGRATLLDVVADHAIEFDAFAADQFAYSEGDTIMIECHVRDLGARPGGTFAVAFRVKDGSKVLCETKAEIAVTADAATTKAALKLPDALKNKGPLDLEVAAPQSGALRRVAGFIRIRQAMASRVAILKPGEAAGMAAFLFEGETVERQSDLGNVEGEGPLALVAVSGGSTFFANSRGVPMAQPASVIERAASRALASVTPAGDDGEHQVAWGVLIDGLGASTKSRAKGPVTSPSEAAAAFAAGDDFEKIGGAAAKGMHGALSLTHDVLNGGRLPATELANLWVTAAEKAAANPAAAPVGAALSGLRRTESELRARLERGGLAHAELVRLAQASLLRRAVEAELIARAVKEGAPDHVLSLSITLKAQEERLRAHLRYWARLAAKHRQLAERCAEEAHARRKLSALREARVELKGADAIMPGRYNAVELRVSLPPGAASGGLAAAALMLPSSLWIMANETARQTRGQYLLEPLPIEPGGSAAWRVEIYVPDRAGSEGGAIEVRVGFADDAQEADKA